MAVAGYRLKSFIVATLVGLTVTAHAQPAPPPSAPPLAPAPAPPPAPSSQPAPVADNAPPGPVSTPTPAPAPAESPSFALSSFQIHGFISEGGFVSTANDYIGDSSNGSLEFFEAGLNVTTQITDRLRAGVQLYGRDQGGFHDLPPSFDWAFLDYRIKPWLGVRAGIIKMPFGLYNEYADADASRTAILMPQSIYPLRDRTTLVAQTGFEVYGERELGRTAGSLEYQAWLGTLNIPADALEISGATLNSSNAKYVTGAQLFWHTPLDGLRVGGTYLRTSIDFDLTLDASTLQTLIMLGLVPPTFNGALVVSARPAELWVTSAEYTRDDWLFAAEYGRSNTHQESSLATLLPTSEQDSERFYVLASHRICKYLEAGAYYSVVYADVNDRLGHNKTEFPESFEAWQRDAAATVRFDVNDHWLWKVEGHFIDGAADLDLIANPKPERYWGLFLLKTTVTF